MGGGALHKRFALQRPRAPHWWGFTLQFGGGGVRTLPRSCAHSEACADKGVLTKTQPKELHKRKRNIFKSGLQCIRIVADISPSSF